jgi:hypothetical protein
VNGVSPSEALLGGRNHCHALEEHPKGLAGRARRELSRIA